MATIKDIAKLADVSIATVSRVLNGQAGVSEQKRQRVLQVATDNHYNLSRYETTLLAQIPDIAVILGDGINTELVPQYKKAFHAAQVDNCAADLKIQYYSDKDLKVLENLMNQLIGQESSNLAGIIVCGTPDERLRKNFFRIRGRGYPIVLVRTNNYELAPLSRVGVNCHAFYDHLMAFLFEKDLHFERITFVRSRRPILADDFCSDLMQSDPSKQDLAGADVIVRVFEPRELRIEELGAGDLVVCDSPKLTRQVLAQRSEKNNFQILGFGLEHDLRRALDDGQVLGLIDVQGETMSYMALDTLLKRIQHQSAVPEAQYICPIIRQKEDFPLSPFDPQQVFALK